MGVDLGRCMEWTNSNFVNVMALEAYVVIDVHDSSCAETTKKTTARKIAKVWKVADSLHVLVASSKGACRGMCMYCNFGSEKRNSWCIPSSKKKKEPHSGSVERHSNVHTCPCKCVSPLYETLQ